MAAAPTQAGQKRSRWTLGLIQSQFERFQEYTLSGVWRWLRGKKIHYKRGQQHVHSPDPSYAQKAAYIQALLREAREHPWEVVVLFLDEVSYTRWALVAPVYAPAGRQQPQVELPCGYNTVGRILGVLDAVTGQVHFLSRSKIRVAVLVEMLTILRSAYPQAKRIYLIQDNWHNVHFHPRQVAAAETAHITLVAMPTYAPWLNPIEKLWRKLKQEIVLMHANGQEWEVLRQRVCDFLNQFAKGSPELVKYVGLMPN